METSLENLATEHSQVVPITIYVAVLAFTIVIGQLLEDNRWVNESITAILIGCISGMISLFVSKGKSSRILRFNEQVFFIYLLPPIIFNAGFQVKKKQFFHNFLTIVLFGVFGVFISTFLIAAGSWWLFPKIGFHGLTTRDYLAIGTIFSATDTVCTLQVLHQDETPLLYSLVFGEGVVNDATSVVLFNAIQKLDVNKPGGRDGLRLIGDFLYLFFTSTLLGVTVSLFFLPVTILNSAIALGDKAGLVTAYALKVLYFSRHSTDREISLMVLMAYLSYMAAELFELSGILTVFFCGIAMSHYAWHNVTENSRITTRHIFATMSFIAEAFIFLYVGTDVFDIQKWRVTKLDVWRSIQTYACIVFLILVGRAAFVFPLSAFSNLMNRRNSDRRSSIKFKNQVVIWWAGLMRGAVSIALAFKQFTYSGVTLDPVNATMVTSTVIVVLFTTLVFGFLTKPLILWLMPNQTCNAFHEARSPKEELDVPFLSMEESTTTNLMRAKDSLTMLLDRPVYTIHSYWRRFDDSYMRPIFGGPLADHTTR